MGSPDVNLGARPKDRPNMYGIAIMEHHEFAEPQIRLLPFSRNNHSNHNR